MYSHPGVGIADAADHMGGTLIFFSTELQLLAR